MVTKSGLCLLKVLQICMKRWEHLNRCLWKDSVSFSNMSQWLQYIYATLEFHPLYKVLPHSSSKAIPNHSNSNSVPRICSVIFFTRFHTCYKYLQQIERKGRGRFLQADEKTWRILFVASAECEYNCLSADFLYSLWKTVLWYTPTVLLSLIISFPPFKLPAYIKD